MVSTSASFDCEASGVTASVVTTLARHTADNIHLGVFIATCIQLRRKPSEGTVPLALRFRLALERAHESWLQLSRAARTAVRVRHLVDLGVVRQVTAALAGQARFGDAPL